MFMEKKVDCSYFSADGSSEGTFCDFCHNLSVIVCVSLWAAKKDKQPQIASNPQQIKQSWNKSHQFSYFMSKDDSLSWQEILIKLQQ